MRIIVYLGHPAHFYNYKNTIASLKADGHEVAVLIQKKDILEDLLRNANIPFRNILSSGRKTGKLELVRGMIKRAWRLNKFCDKFKPDLLTGTSVENSFVGTLRRIPVININEDDASVVPQYAKLSYPGANVILCPTTCNCGKWDGKKTIKYNGYHELAYLHPNHFTPDFEVVKRYFGDVSTYFVLRFSALKAHHDDGIKGIDNERAKRLVDMLLPYGRVYITSERELDSSLEPYRIAINPLDIHHVIAFSSIYIGDSQTMAAEAAVLGVPFIRYNDFVGRIGYLNELENVYHLGFGIKASEEGSQERLYNQVKELLDMPDRAAVWQERRQKMLSEKIDYAKFLTWFIEDYPNSADTMRKNPDYQWRFK